MKTQKELVENFIKEYEDVEKLIKILYLKKR